MNQMMEVASLTKCKFEFYQFPVLLVYPVTTSHISITEYVSEDYFHQFALFFISSIIKLIF